MSHPPVPESEFSPPWHQYFVKLKDYITTYFTANDTRLDAIEASIDVITADDEDWTIGCVAHLSFASATILTANEKIEVSGVVLTAPIYYANSATDWPLYISYSGPVVGVGQWRLINPPNTSGTFSSEFLFNFKRIS